MCTNLSPSGTGDPFGAVDMWTSSQYDVHVVRPTLNFYLVLFFEHSIMCRKGDKQIMKKEKRILPKI